MTTELKTATIYAPPALDPSTLSNPRLALRSTCGGWFAFWCPKSQCSGVYNVGLGLWALHGPITVFEHLAMCRARGMDFADEVLRQWIEAVGEMPLPDGAALN